MSRQPVLNDDLYTAARCRTMQRMARLDHKAPPTTLPCSPIHGRGPLLQTSSTLNLLPALALAIRTRHPTIQSATSGRARTCILLSRCKCLHYSRICAVVVLALMTNVCRASLRLFQLSVQTLSGSQGKATVATMSRQRRSTFCSATPTLPTHSQRSTWWASRYADDLGCCCCFRCCRVRMRMRLCICICVVCA
jgi:hypothetical protein